MTYWRKLASREWFSMLISVVLAALLWNFVGGEQTVDKNVMIPVEVINLPRDLVISNQYKKEIEVAVNGPRALILELEGRQITRQIDLSKAVPGTTVITNDVDSIPMRRGITVLRVQPASIILSLDKLIQKKFSINPVTTGEPSPGYILKRLQMDPETITITGPETVLSQYDVLRTKVININGLRKSIQQQVPLDLEPAIVDLIGETTITADITVALETVQKQYKIKLAEPIKTGDKLIEQVHVIANVPKLLINNKTNVASLLSAMVVEDKENGFGVVRIIPSKELTLPVEVISIDPATVELEKPPAAPEQVPQSQAEPSSLEQQGATEPEQPETTAN